MFAWRWEFRGEGSFFSFFSIYFFASSGGREEGVSE